MRIKKANSHNYAVFTGKSIACGGAKGRTQATGYGVVECVNCGLMKKCRSTGEKLYSTGLWKCWLTYSIWL